MKYPVLASQRSNCGAHSSPCHRLVYTSLAALAIGLITQLPAAAQEVDDNQYTPQSMSLAGQWAFKLDPQKLGHEQKWFQTRLPDRIKLPGSTDKAVDGDPNTIWHTPWENNAPNYPHEIQIDLTKVTKTNGFFYLPRQDIPNGLVA